MEMVQFLDSHKKHLGNDIFSIIHGPENVNLMINTFVMMIVMKCMKLKSSLLKKNVVFVAIETPVENL